MDIVMQIHYAFWNVHKYYWNVHKYHMWLL